MSAPSAYAMEQAFSALQRAMHEHDEDVEVEALPEGATALELLDRVLREALWNAAQRDSATELSRNMSARAARYDRRCESLTATALQAMQMLDIKRRELPDMTVSTRQTPPKVLVTDFARVPAAYRVVKEEPDKRRMLDDLKQGVVIDGAELSNGTQTLQIRTK